MSIRGRVLTSCAWSRTQKTGEAKAAEEEVEEATRARMGSVKHKLLVLSGKGGVGKSTLAVQLAMALSKNGDATGILDIDVCGPSVPRMVGAEDREVRQAASGWQPVWVSDSLCVMSIGFMLPSRNEAVVWRGARKNGLITQFVRDVDWGELEYLVVDSPPGTSDEHITLAKLMKGTEGVSAIIVTTPQEIALLDVRKVGGRLLSAQSVSWHAIIQRHHASPSLWSSSSS